MVCVEAAMLNRFGDDAIALAAQAFDLGLDHIPRFEKFSFGGAEAAWRAGGKDVSWFERKHVREIFDLFFRRENHLAGVAVLHDFAVDGERQAAIYVIGHAFA